MAFYLALFNVNNASNELKNKTKKNNRRHSMATTHDVAVDYRLLPKPRIVASNHQLSHLSGSPTPHRRKSDTSTCHCELDAIDASKNLKKVTFTPSDERLHLSNSKRNYSDLFLAGNPDMSQSLYPTTDSARAQRAAEWIYSISLADKNTEPIENGNPSPTVSASEVPPTAPVPEVISPTMANKEVQADPAGIDQSQRSNAIPRVQSPCPPKPNYPADQQPRILPTADSKPPIPTLDFQSRPQSKLPSILRRKSTSDRSASVTTVFRRTYRALSPKKSEEPRRYSLIAVEPKAKVPSRLPLPTRSRCLVNRHEFSPLLQHDHSEMDEMIRSIY